MKGKDIYRCKSEKCINVKVNPKMYVLADFMSIEQHALCDCSYENENISIYLSPICPIKWFYRPM